jgi:hypothetical protein
MNMAQPAHNEAHKFYPSIIEKFVQLENYYLGEIQLANHNAPINIMGMNNPGASQQRLKRNEKCKFKEIVYEIKDKLRDHAKPTFFDQSRWDEAIRNIPDEGLKIKLYPAPVLGIDKLERRSTEITRMMEALKTTIVKWETELSGIGVKIEQLERQFEQKRQHQASLRHRFMDCMRNAEVKFMEKDRILPEEEKFLENVELMLKAHRTEHSKVQNMIILSKQRDDGIQDASYNLPNDLDLQQDILDAITPVTNRIKDLKDVLRKDQRDAAYMQKKSTQYRR